MKRVKFRRNPVCLGMTNIPNITVTPAEQSDALVETLAEGFVYLAEHGLLGEFQDIVPPEVGSNKA